MIKCPSCAHDNVPGTQFCEGCGEELAQPASAAAPASAGAMVKCPACDNMNPADNVACEVCGSELSHAGGSSPAMPAPPSDPGPAPITPIPANLSAPDAGALGQGALPVAVPVADASDATVTVPPTTPLPDLSLPVAPVAAPTDAAVDTSSIAAPSTPLPSTPGNLAPSKVKLVVEQGQTVGAQFILGDSEMLVGREDTDEDIYPDIDLSDQDAGYVHRRHATLRFDNGNLSVEHLGGSNKTRVNNKPVPDNEPQPLKLGDKVAFGKVVLRVLPA